MPRRGVSACVCACLILAAVTGCDGGGDETEPLPTISVALENAFPGLMFVRPVDLRQAPEGSNAFFVVEQAGNILAFENDPTASDFDVFLQIQARVSRENNEEGLLGMAFHPQYAQNGYFYVYYSAANPRRSVVSRFRVSANPLRADHESEMILLEILQPFGNHNGGQLQFGPDGYLYIGLGDGGSGGDPQGNGQNPRTLLGSLLRIDVNGSSDGRNYAIPPDNPFAGNSEGFHEEIYAYGLRNPWRFSFDRETGWLWLADVGQERLEEINVIESGGNYGWSTMEGTLCFRPSDGCDRTGLELPIWVYNRTLGGSVSGGYVYRGTSIPALQGRYIYGDFLSGRVWALHYDGGEPQTQQIAGGGNQISGFGQDRAGEVYVLTFNNDILRFVPAE